MSVARSTLHYESRLIKRDAPVVAVMRELAGQYPRYGYRRIQIFLERRGHTMSADRAHRLWRQCGLQVPSLSTPDFPVKSVSRAHLRSRA
jgi:putative transposase